jgi:cell division protein FtsB
MEKKKVALIVVTIAVVIVFILLLPGYTKLQDLIAENRRLEKRIAELKNSIDTLEEEKDKLQSDILYIEKVAREKLGVVREDEVVIKQKR